ncbi:Tim44 domain-containing protein [Desulfohalovibrio reitneri]|uniref:Tim44 domain-containing protein n=1 Tax=Desulfohalovibrio reitneri TaxID=1307759 RepID=UPI0004A6CC74|nr:TIM44-like domain-containing protein [Desulfohalovibrio reitneri]
MPRLLSLFCIGLMLFGTLAVVMPEDAEAKRFGGGRSFGSRSLFKSPAQKPGPSQSVNRQSATRQQQGAANPGMRRSPMGGLFGGLLAGTLLGSLFMGMPFGGFGMMDLLFIVLIFWIGMRVLGAMRGKQRQPSGHGSGMDSGPPSGGGQHQRAEQMWERFQGGQRSGHGPGPAARDLEDEPEDQKVETPEGFDAEEFLRGAKIVYTRLQTAWDNRDLDDIRQFCTEAVADEIARQAEDDPEPSKTEVLVLEARLLEAKRENGRTTATVYYEATLREDSAAQAPEQAREVWHFVRDETDGDSSWKLDGIQQVQ